MGRIRIEVVNPAGLAEVNNFYQALGYGGGVSPADLTLAARSNGRLLGAVRLCTEDGVLVLRGMQVAAEVQGRGIGRALLDQCLPWLDRGPAYCLPYEHLVHFYGGAGFVLAPADVLPPFLAQRLAGYVGTKRRVLAMRRMPAFCSAARTCLHPGGLGCACSGPGARCRPISRSATWMVSTATAMPAAPGRRRS